MSQGRSRGKASKGVIEFRPYVTRVIPVGARIVCADNTGAKILEVVNVHKYHTRVSRLPAAAVGDFCNVVEKKVRLNYENRYMALSLSDKNMQLED